MQAASSLPVTPPGIWQNEANCKQPSSLRASPRHSGPRGSSEPERRASSDAPSGNSAERSQRELAERTQRELAERTQRESFRVETAARHFGRTKPMAAVYHGFLSHRRSQHPETSALASRWKRQPVTSLDRRLRIQCVSYGAQCFLLTTLRKSAMISALSTNAIWASRSRPFRRPIRAEDA
jgi:hypothetical protein